MRAHEASGTIEIWAPPATRMLLYRSGEGWRDGDRRAARVEVVELRELPRTLQKHILS